jgi:exosortase/archaeosortase family protein
MDVRQTLGMFARYLILALVPLGGMALFYLVFTPLTIYPVFWILKKIYADSVLLGTTTLYFQEQYANIVPACVAGAAYYLLVILNLTTPMPLLQRLKSLVFMLVVFLALNILRIVIFANLLAQGANYFDIAHQMAWYFGSTVLIIIVWFITVLIFGIRNIPIYTDVTTLIAEIRSTSSVPDKKQTEKDSVPRNAQPVR